MFKVNTNPEVANSVSKSLMNSLTVSGRLFDRELESSSTASLSPLAAPA